MQIKSNGAVIETKQEERNGQPVGIVAGYLATYDLDRGNDRFERGAFAEAIEDLKQRNRPLRMRYNHFKTIGGFPPDTLREDEKGLYGEGEINLNTQTGRETFAMAKQGVLSDFSVGFGFEPQNVRFEEGVRVISKSKLWEASLVDEPMNPEAVVTAVKEFEKFPLADFEYKFDEAAATERWEKYCDGDDDLAGDGYLYGYGTLLVDVIKGVPHLVPRAIFAARCKMAGARGGFENPGEAKMRATVTLNDLYARMDLEPPFMPDGEKNLTRVEAKRLPDSYLADMIVSGKISHAAADWLASLRPSVKEGTGPSDVERVEAELNDRFEKMIAILTTEV
jgi:HK97 family phage prohead protease